MQRGVLPLSVCLSVYDVELPWFLYGLGTGPPIFDLQGCSTQSQSRVQHTIFVNVIDCVVGTVVEQVS